MASIPGLYATGIGFSVNTQDTNWEFSLISGSCSIPSYGYVAADGEVNATWDESDLSVARWLTPAQDANATFASPCVYRCRITFAIPDGYDATSAWLILKYEADDFVTVKLNDVTKVTGSGGFLLWTTLDITTGFVSGSNTLDIEVTNNVSNSPTGVRAYFDSSFSGNEVEVIEGDGALLLPAMTLSGSGLAGHSQMFTCNT